MTIGELIAALEACDPVGPVSFDFCGFQPDLTIDSYRGIYHDLALGWTEMKQPQPSVAQLLEICKRAIGQTFTGYKGGNYKMDDAVQIWVDKPGRATQTAIVNVDNQGYFVVIRTDSEL